MTHDTNIENKIKDIMKNNITCYSITISKDKELMEYINSRTPLLQDDSILPKGQKWKLITKLFWIFNDIENFPVCKLPGCGKQLIRNVRTWTCSHPYDYCCSAHVAKDPLREIKSKETRKKKYGDENYRNMEKVFKTKTERYGNPTYVNPEKQAETCMQKYGVKTTALVPEFIEKRKLTCKEKYNTEWAISAPEVRQKTRQTVMNNYGVDNVFLLHEVQQETRNTQFELYIKPYQTGEKKVIDYIRSVGITNEETLHLYDEYYKDNLFSELLFNTWVSQIHNSYDHLFESYIVPNFTFEEYLNVFDRKNHIFEWKCKKCGNVFLSRILPYLRNSYEGHPNARCIKCNPPLDGTSLEERDIQNFISSKFKNVVLNSFSIISPYQLDIYLPDYNTAIEFNGAYWHSVEKKSDKYYHLNKTKRCEDKGIKLIHIWEDEWVYYNDETKTKIINIINNNDVFNDDVIVLDRSKYNKSYNINGYELIKEEDVQLKTSSLYNLQYYDCGNLIYRRTK